MHSEPRPHFYTPHAQSPRADLAVAVRTSADPRALAPAVRTAVAAVDPDQPIAELRTMDQVIADSLADRRFNMLLLAVFAALALLLSGLLYGIPAADPLTFGACVAGLSLASLIASLVPGLRATRVDPMITLRAE